MISYKDFSKLDIRIGKVLSCESVPNSENLLKLSVDVGEEEPRTILSGIKKWYNSEDLVNEYITVLLNLQPRKIFGITSNGMLLAADVNESAILLKPEKRMEAELIPGTRIE